MTHCYECDYHDHDGASGYCNKFETWTNMDFSCENDRVDENKELLEEAIKHFKSLQKRYTREHNGKMCTKVAVALEAMEKQVPRKVCATTNRFNVTHYRCPRCECHAELEYENQRYCDDCGQALDWSDVE